MLDGVIVGIFVEGSCTIDTESCANHLIDFGIHATLEVDAVLLIALIDTLFAIITNTKMVVDAFAAAAHCEVVVLLTTVLGH